MSDTELAWKEIDPSTMSKPLQTAYAAYKESYAKASELRKTFEAMTIKALDLPKGRTAIFGYRFGRLSLAIGDERKPKGSKAVSLASLAPAAA